MGLPHQLKACTFLLLFAAFARGATEYTCIDPYQRCTDVWCNDNCNHNPSYCPATYCKESTPPAPPPTDAPTPTPTFVGCQGEYDATSAGGNFGGPKIKTKNKGYTGDGYVDFQKKNDEYMQWTIPNCKSESVVLVFRYALGSNDQYRPLELSINGDTVDERFPFPRTSPWKKWNIWGITSVVVELQAGENVVKLLAVGQSGANIDRLVVQHPESCKGQYDVSDDHPNVVLTGAEVATNHRHYSGNGFVDVQNGGVIKWTFPNCFSEEVRLVFTYALGGQDRDRPLELWVNGVMHEVLSFPTTGGWSKWGTATSSVVVNLHQDGESVVKLVAVDNTQGANIDRLEVEGQGGGRRSAGQAVFPLPGWQEEASP